MFLSSWKSRVWSGCLDWAGGEGGCRIESLVWRVYSFMYTVSLLCAFREVIRLEFNPVLGRGKESSHERE